MVCRVCRKGPGLALGKGRMVGAGYLDAALSGVRALVAQPTDLGLGGCTSLDRYVPSIAGLRMPRSSQHSARGAAEQRQLRCGGGGRLRARCA